jgi:hypothetical protein
MVPLYWFEFIDLPADSVRGESPTPVLLLTGQMSYEPNADAVMCEPKDVILHDARLQRLNNAIRGARRRAERENTECSMHSRRSRRHLRTRASH